MNRTRLGLSLFVVAFASLLLFVAPVSAEDPKGETKARKSYPKSVKENGPLPADAKSPSAIYLQMSDGTKIACDVWLPDNYDRQAKEPVKLPTIMRMTRYLREIHLTPMAKSDPQMLKMAQGYMRDLRHGKGYTSQGYAYVSVDARGTGASFGSRAHPWEKREIVDYGEIADWISKQSWSNGRIGAVGVSYEGNTAEFIAANQHPAVKVVVPMFDEFDVYHHVSHPGGCFNDWFIGKWAELNKSLDANDVQSIAKILGVPEQMRGMIGFMTTGAKPVDADTKLKDRNNAVKDHKKNGDVYAMAKKITFRDESAAKNGSTMDDLSPFNRQDDISRSDALIYGWASWLDAGTAEGALARFMSYKNKQSVLIGPWSHGGGGNRSPLPNAKKDTFHGGKQGQSLIAFLDAHLKGSDDDVAKARKAFKPTIKYYLHGTGEWRTTDTWPPKEHLEAASESAVDGREHWHFHSDGKLSHVADTTNKRFAIAKKEYKVDYSHSSGTANRWHTQLRRQVNYTDRRMEDKKLLTFTSAPLSNDVEIIGTPTLQLRLSTDREDAAVFAYLTIFNPKTGESTYVTEGQLRLMHRKLGDPKDAPYKQFGVYHSFKKSDALPVKKGEEMDVQMNLFPTAVRIPKGMAIRIAIGGHDASVFQRYPAKGDQTFTLSLGAPQVSGINLPIRHMAEKKTSKKED